MKYVSAHRYDIPAYRRSGGWNVLGLPSSQKIERHGSSDRFMIISDEHFNHDIRRDRGLLGKVHRLRELRITPHRRQSGVSDINADFLPLRSAKRNVDIQNEGQEQSDSSSDTGDRWQSMGGKLNPSKAFLEDSDLEDLSNSLHADKELLRLEAYDRNLRLESAVLLKKVDSDPNNGEAWLDLIEQQDRLLEHREHSSKVTGASGQKLSAAATKLSIYEKAIEKVEDPQFRQRLLLGMMSEGAKIWDKKVLSSNWVRLLKQNPNDIRLWIDFLAFRQTNYSTFRFNDVKDVCIQSLRMLKDSPPGSVKHTRADDIGIYLILRLTLFLREAGFSEHAVAIWQAILEFNFYRPDNGENIWKFEEFWESEVPRIGEIGSRGWAKSAAGDCNPPEPVFGESAPSVKNGSQIELWHVHEQIKSLQNRKPARTLDEVDEEDPYQVILFSDIEPFLENLITAHESPSSIVYGFLAFCHLPPLAGTPDYNSLWWRNPFIRNETLSKHQSPLDSWLFRNSSCEQSIIQSDIALKTSIPSGDPFSFPTSNFLTSADSLFARPGCWFSTFDQCVAEYRRDMGPLSISLVRQVLKALVAVLPHFHELAEYVLAFEYTFFPDAAKKTAKLFLKSSPSNLRLYNAYALINLREGMSAIAAGVIVSALSMGQSMNTLSQNGVLLWRTWIWETLEYQSPQVSLAQLLTYPNANIDIDTVNSDAISNPTAILRAQRVSQSLLTRSKLTGCQALIENRDHELSLYSHGQNHLNIVYYIDLLVLLTYLTNSLSFSAALSNFAANTALLTPFIPSPSRTHELLHQSRAKLLYYHTMHDSSSAPSLIRSTLLESITLFPENTIFLSLYAYYESRFRIDDRVRAVIRDVLFSPLSTDTTDKRKPYQEPKESVIPHFFAIYTELNRSPVLGANVHSVRNSFERAISTKAGQQSASIWKLYFVWEHSKGDMQKAKGVFWRAVQACPWVKELYLLAFRYLQDMMPLDELRGVYETLVDRELRVHISLDDVWERMDEERSRRH